MELDAAQLYADRVWVHLGAAVTAPRKKELLQSAKHYAESFGVEDLTCALEKTAHGGLLSWGANKALVVSCPLGDYEYLGLFTLHLFANHCVVGGYKLLLGDSFFAVNQSAEVRRRVVVDKLRQLELVDRFFLLDKLSDLVGDFLQASVKEGLS